MANTQLTPPKNKDQFKRILSYRKPMGYKWATEYELDPVRDAEIAFGDDPDKQVTLIINHKTKRMMWQHYIVLEEL